MYDFTKQGLHYKNKVNVYFKIFGLKHILHFTHFKLSVRVCDVEYGDRCFILMASPLSWHDAFDSCESDNGRLAEVDNRDINAQLKAITAGMRYSWL